MYCIYVLVKLKTAIKFETGNKNDHINYILNLYKDENIKECLDSSTSAASINHSVFTSSKITLPGLATCLVLMTCLLLLITCLLLIALVVYLLVGWRNVYSISLVVVKLTVLKIIVNVLIFGIVGLTPE